MKKFAVVEKQFQYKGHDCICVFTRNGCRCGYVSTILRCYYGEIDVNCHGGLTFGDALPTYYAPKEDFYYGFDCGHYRDGLDIKLAYDLGLIDKDTKRIFEQSFSYLSGYPVRDVDYVVEQCKKIADQLEVLEK